MKKAKRLNWKNIILVATVPVVLLLAAFTFKVEATPNQIKADINIEEFREDNQKHYSHMTVMEVPTFETKAKETQEMVVIVDFGAFYKGGHQHLVLDAQNGESSDTPEGRKLILLDDRNDKEAEYYKSFFASKK